MVWGSKDSVGGIGIGIGIGIGNGIGIGVYWFYILSSFSQCLPVISSDHHICCDKEYDKHQSCTTHRTWRSQGAILK